MSSDYWRMQREIETRLSKAAREARFYKAVSWFLLAVLVLAIAHIIVRHC